MTVWFTRAGGSPQFWVGLHRARLAGRTTIPSVRLDEG